MTKEQVITSLQDLPDSFESVVGRAYHQPGFLMLIHYTTRFQHEVDEQAEYLAQYSVTRAALFVDSLFRQLELLKPHSARTHGARAGF